MKIKHTTKPDSSSSDQIQLVILSESNHKSASAFLKAEFGLELEVKKSHAGNGKQMVFSNGSLNLILLGIGKPRNEHEAVRRAVAKGVNHANDFEYKHLTISYPDGEKARKNQFYTAMAEAAALTNYQFLTYKSDKQVNALEKVSVYSADEGDKVHVARGAKVARATAIARDLVNEPVITLTAEEMAKRAEGFGKEFGFSVEVFNKAKIQSLKMGGLLAVNLGSIDPPTFTIMEWKPKNTANSKPVVLVGKGVVYDTGGLSLKPTANSMDKMKADMGGAATVIGALCGIAALELPVHVIGLVPATDNRPGQLAYTPGDVIKMFDGSTVEVLNTDAEGRMILADALAYAKKYDPELVIDFATLTGAQVVAIGEHGCAMMGTASKKAKAKLTAAGDKVYERLVELPLWDEYRDQLKSDIADMKNIGGAPAGCITAGKFLEHFTDYPWIHVDIAGPSFLSSNDAYRLKNGTGVGVRLLLEFLSQY